MKRILMISESLVSVLELILFWKNLEIFCKNSGANGIRHVCDWYLLHVFTFGAFRVESYCSEI